MAKTHESPLLDHPSKLPASSSFKTVCIVLSFLALVACPTTLYLLNHQSHDSLSQSHICSMAHDKISCLALVTPLAAESNEIGVLNKLLINSVLHIEDVVRLTKRVHNEVNDLQEQSALTDCVTLMDSSKDRIVSTISVLSKNEHDIVSLDDAKTWLSSVLTNHVTCMDGLNLHGSLTPRKQLESHLKDLIARASTSLAILSKTTVSEARDMIDTPLDGEMPSWVAPSDQKLLSAPAMNADVVVAKDGSGKYKTVKEAVAAAPVNSKVRYSIYVKRGTYKENIEIPKNKKNLMLTGDGMGLTIITGSLNVVDGSTTFNSATLIVSGDGFIAQDLWIQNTAGPSKHQAVALRVSADQTVINRCRLDAYQDTLYTHTLRQFYRDCTITGTVDFIFGNAAVVLQKCNLVPRKPNPGQGNMVTAQGRLDPNQNTGISIQDCNIVASSDLEPVKKTVRSYLGRPWKEYSRTVVMQSNIADVIDPTGWSIWDKDFALKTLYYGEYMNRGAGAGTSKRVTWPGYHVMKTAAEANKFTVASLIQGGVWLKSTGVAYTEGL